MKNAESENSILN